METSAETAGPTSCGGTVGRRLHLVHRWDECARPWLARQCQQRLAHPISGAAAPRLMSASDHLGEGEELLPGPMENRLQEGRDISCAVNDTHDFERTCLRAINDVIGPH